MTRPLSIVFLLLLCVVQECKGQGEANHWFMGQFAGLDFSGGAPVFDGAGQINQAEGVAGISDPAGNLLFYTSGITIYNKLHLPMVNGAGLLGGTSSTQSAVIVQKPGSATNYYVICAAEDLGAAGITYSEVNTTLSAGNGAVTAIKNVSLYAGPSSEKLCGVRHCNNIDAWILSHDYGTNTFRTWLATAAGMNMVPVLSNTGYAPNTISQTAYGCLVANPQGTKIATAFYGYAANTAVGCRVEISDFNNSTGVISNTLNLGVIVGAYGVQFSASGRYLFAATNTGNLYQFDLCAGSNAAIIGSRYTVTSATPFLGTIQLAPDGKMYVSRGPTPWLATIANPDVYGGGCGFTLNSFSLAGKNGMFGLPNFCSYYLRNDPPPFSAIASGCGNITLQAITDPITCTSPISCSWHWTYPGGTATGSPVTVFVGNGVHSVALERRCQCYSNSITQDVTVSGGIMAKLVIQ